MKIINHFILKLITLWSFLSCSHLSFAGLVSSVNYPENYPENYFSILFDINTEIGLNQEPEGVPMPKSSSDPSLVSSYDKILRNIIKVVPNSSLRSGIEQYLDIINAQAYSDDQNVGLSNRGLAQFQANQVKNNPCFAKLAEAFYQEITEQDSTSRRSQVPNSRSSLGSRPSLATEAGKLPNENVKPGWLYQKALEYTNGNPNLAIQLIGLCGHDDISQGDFKYEVDGDDQSQSEIKDNYLKTIEYRVTKLRNALQKINSSQGESNAAAIDKMNNQIEKLKSYKQKLLNNQIVPFASIKRTINCPRQISTMYLSKSLSKQADLSDEYKAKIAKIQAPTKGASVIPSKNYHIMGSAFMTCQLIQKGVNPKIAQAIQKLAAWGYRTVRMNTVLKEELEKAEKVYTQYEVFLKNYTKENTEFRQTRRGKRALPLSRPSISDWLLTNQSAREELSLNFETKSEVNDFLISLDAAKLIDQANLGGNTFGLQLPQTNILLGFTGNSIRKEINLSNINSEQSETTRKRGSSFKATPNNWDKTRFNRAKEKAQTYLIDWDWTVKQHEVGAKFAAENCTREQSDQNIDNIACEAFTTRPGITCDLAYNTKQTLPMPENKVHGEIKGGGVTVIADDSTPTEGFKKISEQLEKTYLDPEVTTEGNEIEGLY